MEDLQAYFDNFYFQQAREEILERMTKVTGGDSDHLIDNDYESGTFVGVDENYNPVYIDDDTFAVMIDIYGAVRGITDKYDVARQFVELGLGESVVLDDYAGQSACDIQNEFIEILQRDYPHFFSPTL